MLLIVVPSVALGLLAIFGAASYVILGEFQDLETRQEAADVSRTIEALDARRDELDRTARDWAHWDDTHSFVQGQFPEYVAVDLAPKSFAAYGLSFMLYLSATPDGESIVYGSGFDPATESYQPLPAQLNDTASRLSLGLVPLRETDGHITGLIRLQDGVHFVSSWAILTSQEEGPVVGTMTWGRRIDASLVDALSEDLHRTVQIEPWGGALTVKAGGADALASDSAWRLQRPNDERMSFSLRLDDIQGNPAILVHSAAPREVYQGGLGAMTTTFLAAAAISAVFIALSAVVLDRLVTGRVGRLGRRMDDLRSGGTGAGNEILGNDEVSALARTFDGLMMELDRRTAELEASNKDLQRYASVANHDLKGPMSTLRLNVAALKARLGDGAHEGVAQTLARMDASIARMAERIDTVLAMSKAHGLASNLQPVSLREVLGQVEADLAADVLRTGATVHVGSLPTVRGDRAQLTQLFQNLLANALKFTRPGEPPQVSVSAEAAGGGWSISVTDHGVGFDPDQAEAVFKPFARLSHTAHVEGQGIGLATCKRIAEKHGGHLAANGRPGAGATFTLWLPAPP